MPPAQKQPPTPQEFIENWPLYTRAAIQNFQPPRSITRMCEGKKCGKDTTWSKSEEGGTTLGPDPNFSFYWVRYNCGLCGSNTLVVLYRKLEWRVDGREGAYFAVHKIGQVPAQSIEIPADLAERLGDTAGYYKNALICRSQSYGIAAVAYMRRVVEEKTDDLIDVVIELAQTYGADADTIKSLQEAKAKVRYEDKLQVASELVPAAMRPAGVNPLGQLYIHLSVGLHGKTDDECIAIFDDLREDFEFVFRNLRVEAEERKRFAQRVQSRASRNVATELSTVPDKAAPAKEQPKNRLALK